MLRAERQKRRARTILGTLGTLDIYTGCLQHTRGVCTLAALLQIGLGLTMVIVSSNPQTHSQQADTCLSHEKMSSDAEEVIKMYCLGLQINI
jgi:hypothetical protein